MTTTRKDLVRLADALSLVKPDPESQTTRYLQWVTDVRAIADALEVTTGFTPNGNRSFDRERFYTACRLKEAQ